MHHVSSAPGLATATSVLAGIVLLAGVPGDAAGAATTATLQSACPGTIEVSGRTAYLAGSICGSVSASFSTPWVISVGVTIGHCTGCECGYTFEGPAGSQFTRRGAAECGWGSAGGGSGSGRDAGLAEDGGCQWGKDFIGWEPRGCG